MVNLTHEDHKDCNGRISKYYPIDPETFSNFNQHDEAADAASKESYRKSQNVKLIRHRKGCTPKSIACVKFLSQMARSVTAPD